MGIRRAMSCRIAAAAADPVNCGREIQDTAKLDTNEGVLEGWRWTRALKRMRLREDSLEFFRKPWGRPQGFLFTDA